MKGFSKSNLYNLRAFAAASNGPDPIVQTPSGQLSWSHNVGLLSKLDDHELRQWYASKAVGLGWSVAVLEHQILTRLHTRSGAAPNNLEARLPGEGTDLAREVAKDPLVLDFLGLTEDAQEHAIEEGMTLRLAQTLAEFGPGFAFVGRQYHLDVDGEDFFLNLLLYHVPSDRWKLGRYQFKEALTSLLQHHTAAATGQAPGSGVKRPNHAHLRKARLGVVAQDELLVLPTPAPAVTLK